MTTETNININTEKEIPLLTWIKITGSKQYQEEVKRYWDHGYDSGKQSATRDIDWEIKWYKKQLKKFEKELKDWDEIDPSISTKDFLKKSIYSYGEIIEVLEGLRKTINLYKEGK